MKYYHVTIQSNLIYGLSKNSQVYSKQHIPKSTFPDQFFLLTKPDIHVGIEKAEKLRIKLNFKNDRLILLETELDPSEVSINERTGLGVFIPRNSIEVTRLFRSKDSFWEEIGIEKALAESMSMQDFNTLKYQDYRIIRNNVLERNPNLIRLDCMNPYKKMEKFLNKTLVRDFYGANPTNIAAIWIGQTGVRLTEPYVISSGVRDAIQAIFKTHKGKTVWIPNDVYPVYFELAKGLVEVKEFSTYPNFNISFLKETGPDDLVLIPNPVSPAGRFLTEKELNEFEAWLRATNERYLILDLVYNYTHQFKDLAKLKETNKTYCLWSLSKAWILSSSFGINEVPSDKKDSIESFISPPKELDEIFSQLMSNRKFDTEQNDQFKKQWLKLAPIIKAIDPRWLVPEVGYFSVIEKKFTDLLKHGILAIPASVFGSPRSDVSVITCLYDL